MADYIYLLQNRLTPAQGKTLEAVRDAARMHGMTVFLVGGAARDLTSGTPVRDLDFAVQGEVTAMVEDLVRGGATIAGQNPVLSSVYLLFPGGVRTEIGPTLAVTYPKPGQPETQPATILEDLRRRDFTANAMAISLHEGSYGLLLDPLNGVADIENRELRLVSNYGFIEQPSLLLRIARLSGRLGWTLEERTESRYNTAKEESYIRTLSERERGYELEEIFFEEDPLATLEHLTEEGWRDVLYPAWTTAKADREALERVRDLMGQLDQMGIHVDPSPVFFPLLTAKLTPEELGTLKSRFVRPGFVQQIDSLEARSKELAAKLTAKAAAAPSDTWRLLFASEPEVVLWLAFSSRSGAVQSKFKAFLNEWPQMRQRMPYGLMQEMRITPDLPEYNQLLERLFFALIDGKLDTSEATRAFLEPYSPPAPAPQTAPRRRPAKATRSRSKKAASAAVAEPDEIEQEQPSAAANGEAAEDEQPKPTVVSKKAVAKTATSRTAVKQPTPATTKPLAPPTSGKAAEKNLQPALSASTAPVKAPVKAPAASKTPVAAEKAAPKEPAKATKVPSTVPAAISEKPGSPAKKSVAVPPKKDHKPQTNQAASAAANGKQTSKNVVPAPVKTSAKNAVVAVSAGAQNTAAKGAAAAKAKSSAKKTVAKKVAKPAVKAHR